MTPAERQQLAAVQAAAQSRNSEAIKDNFRLQIWLRKVRTAAVIRRTAHNFQRWKHE